LVTFSFLFSFNLQTAERVIVHMMKLKPKLVKPALDEYAKGTNEGDADELR
jgi:hypothetical protein